MKMKIVTLLMALLLVSNIYSAEYKGQNIDGIEFDCSAYSYGTGNWYYVTLEFDGDEATITFSNGGYITLTLDDEVIDDPSAIDAFDYDKSVYWELEVDGLD
jgi:hypothetical protein